MPNRQKRRELLRQQGKLPRQLAVESDSKPSQANELTVQQASLNVTPEVDTNGSEEPKNRVSKVQLILASGALALFVAAIYEYWSLMGFLNMSAARWLLVVAWGIASFSLITRKFIWQRRLRQKVPIALLTALFIAALLYGLDFYTVRHLPQPAPQPAVAAFRVVHTNVFFNRLNDHQLAANVYLKNDGGYATIIGHSAATLAPMKYGAVERDVVINQMRKQVALAAVQGQGSSFSATPGEMRWTTIYSRQMTDADVLNYKAGLLSFVFVSQMTVMEGNATRPLEICGIVTGDNPDVIVECPVVKGQ